MTTLHAITDPNPLSIGKPVLLGPNWGEEAGTPGTIVATGPHPGIAESETKYIYHHVRLNNGRMRYCWVDDPNEVTTP